MKDDIIRFFRMMEMRSSSMFHQVKEISEQFWTDNGFPIDTLEIRAEPSKYSVGDLLNCSIYDRIEVYRYNKNGVRHLVLEIVNSNFVRVADILIEIYRVNPLELVKNREKVISEKISELYSFLRLDDPIGSTVEPSGWSPRWKRESDEATYKDNQIKLERALKNAGEQMSGPMNYFSGASCVQMSGMVGFKDYLKTLKKEVEFPMYDDLVSFAEYFFEKLANRC